MYVRAVFVPREWEKPGMEMHGNLYSRGRQLPTPLADSDLKLTFEGPRVRVVVPGADNSHKFLTRNVDVALSS